MGASIDPIVVLDPNTALPEVSVIVSPIDKPATEGNVTFKESRDENVRVAAPAVAGAWDIVTVFPLIFVIVTPWPVSPVLPASVRIDIPTSSLEPSGTVKDVPVPRVTATPFKVPGM